MQKTFQIAGAVLFLLACFLEWQAIHLRYYTPLGPGPGFFAVWLAGILAALTLGIAVSASFAAPAPLPEDFWPSRTGFFRMTAVIVGLGWMAYFLDRLGYRITALVFLGVLSHVLGLRNWPLLLTVAVIGSFGIYHLFVELLGSPLPKGVFGI